MNDRARILVALTALAVVLAACGGTTPDAGLHLPTPDPAALSAAPPLTAGQLAPSGGLDAPAPSTAASAATSPPPAAAGATLSALAARLDSTVASRPADGDLPAWRFWLSRVADLLVETRDASVALRVGPVADEERGEYLASVDAAIRAYRSAALLSSVTAVTTRLPGLERLTDETATKFADFVRALER